MINFKGDPIIILGMHRSGTTMITKLLEKEGCFFGCKRFMGKNNESYFHMDINNWILKQYNASWDNPLPFLNYYETENIEINTFISRSIQKWLKSYNAYKYSGLKNKLITKCWGWKDPRNTIIFPFWNEIYPNAKFIYVQRNGVDIANSLLVRKKEINKKFRLLPTPKIKGIKRNFANDLPFAQSTMINSLDSAFRVYLNYQEIWLKHIESSKPSNLFTINYEYFVENISIELNNLLAFVGISNLSQNHIDLNKNRIFAYKNNSNLIHFVNENKSLLKKDMIYDY